jgi:alpha-methylacyl-CoA racemase
MGALNGLRVVEMAGIGPGPFAAMMLADMGADVIRIDRQSGRTGGRSGADPLARGRLSAGIDLKNPEGIEAVLRLIESADVLIEGFRPGVMERLGLGPDVCLTRNPRLVYGRMTGWGQDGPLASTAGHDIDYIAISGVLGSIGRTGEIPTPPLNLVGDFGGGALFLAFGVLCGVFEAQRSGQGQVIDAAMVDGASLLMTMIWALKSSGGWRERGSNILDTGAPFYDVYETADGKHLALGAIEPQFYAEFLARTGLDQEDLPKQGDPAGRAVLHDRFTALFRTKTRDEWAAIFDGSDACVAPVLPMSEAAAHPHLVARGTIVDYDGVAQPAPSPRFSRTPGSIQRPPAAPGEHTVEVLTDWGFPAADIDRLRASGAVQ